MTRFVILAFAGALVLPAMAYAQFEADDWELTLGGSGSNNHDFDTGDAAASGSLGYFFDANQEIALRQSVIWADGGSNWAGDTRFAYDYHFDSDPLVPFVGVNIGYVYGPNVEDTWIAGPEAGVKYFLNTTTFIQLIASYEFDLHGSLDEGAFFYGLGLGVRL